MLLPNYSSLINSFSRKQLLIIYICCFVLIILFSLELPFFWDNILLTSKIATAIYQSGFKTIVPPLAFDAGHPPLFPLYIAVVWKLFGRNLFVSHLAMLPVFILLASQWFLLAEKLFKGKYFLLCLFLFLIEPTILAQMTMVAPEIVLLAFFLLGLNSILSQNRTVLLISLVILPLISIRGIFMMITLASIDIVIQYYNQKWKVINFKNVIFYIISIIMFLSWYYYHYLITGWLLFAPSTSRGLDGPFEIFRNIVVIGFDLVLCGRIVVWVLLSFFLYHLSRLHKLKVILSKNRILFTISLLSLLVYCLPIALAKNPTGPRYFLINYSLLILVFVLLLSEINIYSRVKKIMVIIVFLTLISGHFWIFSKISNPWDSSLAHLPFFKAKNEMIQYLSERYPLESIGVPFPIEENFYTNLESQKVRFTRMNLEKDRFILYSNISNDFKQTEKEIIKNFRLIKEVKNKGIYIQLLKRPE